MAPLTWSHSESAPGSTGREAIEIAKQGAWATLSPETRARYLRTLMILSLQAGLMTNAPPRPGGPEGRIEYGRYAPGQYRDRESLEAASTILRTPQLVLPRGAYPAASAKTQDGAPAVPEGEPIKVDVGAVPIVVWVVGIAASAIASIVLAQTAGEVIDRQLTRSEETKKLLGTQASALEILTAHASREQKEGKALALTDAEKAVLNGLFNVQMKIAEKRETPLPSPFAGAAQTFGNAANAIGKGVESFLPWALAAGVGLVLITR